MILPSLAGLTMLGTTMPTDQSVGYFLLSPFRAGKCVPAFECWMRLVCAGQEQACFLLRCCGNNSRMSPSVANVVIHRSQFPENVRNDLYQSLNHRKVNHKFHYDSFRQTQKWLALHEAYSPARTDGDCHCHV